VFDGGCAFCRRQSRLIQRLDWRGAFDTIEYDRAVRMWPEVGRGALGDGLRVRFPDGSVTIGIDAVRSIGVRMPITALPSVLLWVPGFHALGAVAYRAIAARRTRGGASSDANDSCGIA